MEIVREHLDASFAQVVYLSDLAKLTGLAPTCLCRAFNKHSGKTVFEYLLDRRIQATMMALRLTDLNISVIALVCGFNDPAHFNRMFKLRAGRTPKEYRGHT